MALLPRRQSPSHAWAPPSLPHPPEVPGSFQQTERESCLGPVLHRHPSGHPRPRGPLGRRPPRRRPRRLLRLRLPPRPRHRRCLRTPRRGQGPRNPRRPFRLRRPPDLAPHRHRHQRPRRLQQPPARRRTRSHRLAGLRRHRGRRLRPRPYTRRPNGEPVFDDPEIFTDPVQPFERYPGWLLLRLVLNHEDERDGL